ncbi:superoxide dismutase, Cu-Zn family [Muriicola jejuensis]|uniref:Superoxide dismutase family protein n=1 Tax=Muriicola jejuensis TaxID=504488 RepID=A0A6P0UGK6_9FLAO|nr:superoxide dismutase family protein [Muriicola jejuensis]NER10928.1 superoxide dismutase family protein [Muriicola jejuensis]SMP15362.1 superoxide dismutase, Cu-Zn family [Muriicola jejuensis]
MKILKLSALSLLLILGFGCKEAKKEASEAAEEMDEAVEMVKEEVMEETIAFKMEPKSDSKVAGEVSFTEKDGKVMMKASFSGLTPGEHAIHIHEKADCSAADGTSTGGHWNPTSEPHGKWGMSEGYHRGDIGNFTADADGNATVEFTTDLWCLSCEDTTKNITGKAVIVHQGVDDFVSQPSGAAGARISCTGIIK